MNEWWNRWNNARRNFQTHKQTNCTKIERERETWMNCQSKIMRRADFFTEILFHIFSIAYRIGPILLGSICFLTIFHLIYVFFLENFHHILIVNLGLGRSIFDHSNRMNLNRKFSLSSYSSRDVALFICPLYGYCNCDWISNQSEAVWNYFFSISLSK